jgi:hypothetical protein
MKFKAYIGWFEWNFAEVKKQMILSTNGKKYCP